MVPANLSRPKVVANLAISWDGKISSRLRTPSDFSSPEDKRRLIKIRGEGDAVIVSGTTVAADTMTMGIPDETIRKQRLERGQSEYPVRVLVSASGNLNPMLRVFQSRISPVVVFTSERMPESVRNALKPFSSMFFAPASERIDLGWVLEVLGAQFGVSTIVLEGGGLLVRGFLDARLVDELCLTVCPLVFGSASASSVSGALPEYLRKSVKTSLLSMETVGQEIFTRWKCS
jgi:riboflavin-specific deaminase-like protein